MMTRRLIAFLALLTGLAALSGAATASYAHTSSQCDASVSATADSAAASQQAPIERQTAKASRRADQKVPKHRAPAPDLIRMPVLMGVERAYE